MLRTRFLRLLTVAGIVAEVCGAILLPLTAGVGPVSPAPTDLADYKTPLTAQMLRMDALEGINTARMGYLGIETKLEPGPKLVIAAVASNSPALLAGARANDIILRVNGEVVASPDAFRKLVQSKPPGQYFALSLSRENTPIQVVARTTSLATVGRPMDLVRLGVRTRTAADPEGARVLEVITDSPGARAGILVDDIIIKIDGKRVDEPANIGTALAGVVAFQSVKVIVRRDAREIELRVAVGPPDGPERPAPMGRGGRGFLGLPQRGNPGGRGPFGTTNRNELRVAIVGIEFPDVKHNPKISTRDWENEFFSTNTYSGQSATGQAVHGSINDFYRELSVGTMRVTGKMFDWVQVSSNRMDYSPQATIGGDIGGGRGAGRGDFYRDSGLLMEALNKLAARDGQNALSNFDAITFLYAGRTASRNETNLYWPHSAGLNFQNRRMQYTVSPEGGERMADISVLCHELGHVLGLPDLYLRRQAPSPVPSVSANTNVVTISRPSPGPDRTSPNPYAESLGNWDIMAMEIGGGRPQHMSAWSKERLGWLHSTLIDPMVRQKLVLAPVENSTNECFKIPLRTDGSEYLLLENRHHTGFDASLPGEGLLIWRVVYGRPILEEAHGFTGPNAARIEPAFVPFPTERNDSFTPFSKPSSAAFTGDELPVYLTNIRRLPDGRITFWIGYGFD